MDYITANQPGQIVALKRVNQHLDLAISSGWLHVKYMGLISELLILGEKFVWAYIFKIIILLSFANSNLTKNSQRFNQPTIIIYNIICGF